VFLSKTGIAALPVPFKYMVTRFLSGICNLL
jgi:hypothetical protein